MKPLVRQAASAVLARQVDNHPVWRDLSGRVGLIVRCCRVLAACTARAKCQTKFTIERKRFGRYADHAGQVHQRVVGLVQISLALTLGHGRAKLLTPEAERIAELLRGHIGVVAVVNAHPWRVGFPALGGFKLGFGQQRLKLGLVVGFVLARLLGSRKCFEVNALLRVDALADNEHARLAAVAVDVKRRGFGHRWFVNLRSQPCFELLNGLGFGRCNRQVFAPAAGTVDSRRAARRLVDAPHGFCRVEALAPVQGVLAAGKTDTLEWHCMANGFVQLNLVEPVSQVERCAFFLEHVLWMLAVQSLRSQATQRLHFAHPSLDFPGC